MDGRPPRSTAWLIFALLAGLALVLLLRDREPPPPPVTPVAARGDLSAFEQSSTELFRRVSPSVVQVVRMSRGASELGGSSGSGSGFVWDGSHVVTNNHVVEGGGDIAIRLANGDTLEAELVGVAPNYDLAVLRPRGTTSLPAPVAVGTSADLQVGQLAFAIGNPFGLDQTLTMGVISALKRKLPTESGREITDVIQTDAAVNPGNSGGPLLDSAGRLIGVNTAIFSPSGANAGVGFAIPVDIVARALPQLIRDGRVPVAGIGVVTAEDGAAARFGTEGVVIVQVAPGSSAERAGVKGIESEAGRLGDIITGANGQPVRRLADLTGALESTGIGNRVKLDVQRGRRTVTLDVEVVDISRL
jgi:2-alkenal reductase